MRIDKTNYLLSLPYFPIHLHPAPISQKDFPLDGQDFDRQKARGAILSQGCVVEEVPLFNSDGTEIPHAVSDLLIKWYVWPLMKQENLLRKLTRSKGPEARQQDEEKLKEAHYKRSWSKKPTTNVMGGLCRNFMAQYTYLGR